MDTNSIDYWYWLLDTAIYEDDKIIYRKIIEQLKNSQGEKNEN